MTNPLETVLEKVGRILSDRYGIKVICKGNRCCTDGRTIYLPALPDEIPPGLMGAIRAFLDHEVGHIVGESDYHIARRFSEKLGPEAFGVLNTLEDLRVEGVMRGLFAGCGINLDAGYEYAVDKLREKADQLDLLRQVTTGIFSRGYERDDLDFISPQAYAICDEITGEIQAATNAADTAEVEKLAIRAWEIISRHLQQMPQFPQQQGQSQQNEESQQGKGQAGQQSKEGQKESAGKQDSSGEKGDPDQEGGNGSNSPTRCKNSHGQSDQSKESGGKGDSEAEREKSSPRLSTQQESHQDKSPSTNAPSGNQGDQQVSASAITQGSHGPMSDLAGLIEQDVAEHAKSTKAYRAWTTEHDQIVVPQIEDKHDHQALLAQVMPYVGGVRQRLLQSLQAESNCRWFGEQESGRVDRRSLHRLAMNTSARVFRTKVRSRTKSTAVTLLLDLSHSMRGAKIRIAADTCIVFCEALEKLSIPSSVIGFSTAPSGLLEKVARETGIHEAKLIKQYRFLPLLHTVLKQFEEPWRKASGRFVDVKPQHLTPLGESLLFAAKHIAQRREERKVILCLTDGKPVAGIDGEDVTFNHARESIIRIEKAGIEVVLVGIREKCVERLHHKNVIVNTLEDLPNVVIRQMQRILMKGASHETARS